MNSIRKTTIIRRCVALTALASLAIGTALGQHDNAYVGDIWCSDGKFWSPEEYAKAGAGITAKGIVFWVDPEGKADASRMVALKDAAKNVGFSGTVNVNDDLDAAFEVAYDNKDVDNQKAIHGIMCSPWQGKKNTEALRKLIKEGKEYPAAAAITDEVFEAGWYLPSVGELMMLAAQYRHVAASLQAVIDKEGAGSAELMRMQMYHSSSIEAEFKGSYYLAGSGGVRADGKSGKKYAKNMGVRAVRSFSCNPATGTEPGTKIGDLVDFGDGSKGVLVHVARDGQSGWAMALKDADQGKVQWAKAFETKTKALNIEIEPIQESHKDVNPKWDELYNPPYRSMEVLIPVLTDLEGNGHTEAIRKVGTSDEYPAAYAVDFDKGWYLPAAGQMQIIFPLEPFIKKTLEENGGTVPEGYYWTSTPQGEEGTWYLSTQCGIYDYPEDEGKKMEKHRVRAMRNWKATPKPAETYTLAFDGNGATGGTMNSKTVEVGKPVNLPKNAFTRDNHTFLGWSKDKAATVAEHADEAQGVNLDGKKGETLTLYAIWKTKTPEKKTAVASELLAEVKIIGNPFSDRITLVNMQAAETIEVFSVVGKTIYRRTVQGEERVEIETSKWASGAYIIKVSAHDEERVLRAVKR